MLNQTMSEIAKSPELWYSVRIPEQSCDEAVLDAFLPSVLQHVVKLSINQTRHLTGNPRKQLFDTYFSCVFGAGTAFASIAQRGGLRSLVDFTFTHVGR